jgi:hypothetical protein
MGRKFLSAVLGIIVSISLVAYVPCMAFAVTRDAIGNNDYTITNPYEDVNWDTWSAYKGATHVHTVRSDGNVELNDMIEEYYSLGYQALALTDHGTVNYSWTEDQDRLAIFGYQFLSHGNIDELSQERYTQITTGSDRGGNGMTEIPLGIELNGASTSKCHVNSYFADCGHGDLGIDETWPENAVKKSQDAGGICHINHVGEWSDGKDNIGTYDSAFVSRFANLFLNYSACVGMELVNTTDNRTHNDRYLYDETLKVTAPTGRNIYGFCEDDSHDLSDCGKNAQYFMMPSNTQANIRTSMETGAFFACSKNAKTAAELGDGFTAVGDFPMVSRIAVDESRDQISICAYNASTIKMVANGNVVAAKSISSDNQTVTFDLNDYESAIGSYVRFYVTGAGGICYVQPFLLTKTAYSTSTVQFNLPSSDTNLSVSDANGNAVEPINENNYYMLPAGTYTYTASRNGYETQTATFNVTQADISSGTQTKINIELVLDLGTVSTYFYVPETIYLTPTAGTMSTFQYYADRTNSIDGSLTQSSTDTSGNVFFYCDKAASVRISVSGASASNGSINFASGYSVSGNTISTEVTSGSLSTALTSGNGKVLTWTAEYTLVNGETRIAHAYSYVYAPFTSEAAAGMRQVHTYSTDVFNQGVLYSIGFNSVSGGSYTCSKNFFTDSAPTSNTGIGDWFASASNGGVGFGNYKHTSNASDTHTVNGGTGTINVDSSRITNLNQIPNLKLGFWQCDIEGDSVANGYIKQTVDGTTTTLKSLATGVGSAYSSQVNYQNNSGATGTKTITFSAYTQTLRGKRQNNNYYNISLTANYINKDALRLAYNEAIRATYESDEYSAASFAAFETSLANAGAVLGNPASTQENVTSALNALNSATSAIA